MFEKFEFSDILVMIIFFPKKIEYQNNPPGDAAKEINRNK